VFVWTLAIALLLLLFSVLVAGVLTTEFKWNFETWWKVCLVLLAIFAFTVTVRGVQISTRTALIIGGFEIAIITFLSLWLIVDAGGNNTLSVFGTAHANAPGHAGWGGVFAGSVFVILAFIGFEGCVPLVEEARDHRSVTRAVVASAFGIGVLYVLTIYASDVWFGPDKYATFSALANGSPWVDGIARSVWHGGWVVVFLAVANSATGAVIGSTNMATRTLWAMSRAGLAPAIFSRTHPRFKTPFPATIFAVVVGVVVAFALALGYDAPTAASLVGQIVTIGAILLYMIVAAACIAFYWRERRSEFSWLTHAVVPLLAVGAFMPALFNAMGIRVFSFISKLPDPLNKSGIIVAIWLGLGLLVMLWMRANRPEAIARTGQIFLEETAGAPVPAAGGPVATQVSSS
jgi:amino acid transporter